MMLAALCRCHERRQNHRNYRPAIAGISPVAVRLYETADRGGETQSGARQ
jgi:hypothetical protein